MLNRKVEVLLENEGSNIIQISDDHGTVILSGYQVFPGIRFIYTDAHLQSIIFDDRQILSKNVIEISHCKEGRMEYHIDDEFYYMNPGDLAIARTHTVSSFYYPLAHYHGLTIQIDLDTTPDCLSELLKDVIVQPKAIADKFCKEKNCFVVRAHPSLEHIFSELYHAPKQVRKGYFKIKTLELLLFLSTLEVKQDSKDKKAYTKAQVDLAKKVSSYLMEHMEERITLEQLSHFFHISGTHLKNTFKGVYGVSIGTYIRAQKMESAAYMLEYSDKSILEIASIHGYDNGSKFANAFRAIKGMSPKEYRNFSVQNKKEL